MTLIDAILKSLNDLKGKATDIEVYNHIVENNYFKFKDANTSLNTVGYRLWDFIRYDDPRFRCVEEDGITFYYLTKYEQQIIHEDYQRKLKLLKGEYNNLNLTGSKNGSTKDIIKNQLLDVMILTKPAVKVSQGDLTLYATSFKVKDLLIPNFFLVDKLDSSSESTGFQRVLDKTRTKRLADYILKAWKDKDAFLPTSIFLATDKNVSFDPSKNEITFEVEKVCPFNVVDGQHRVQGLIEAAMENPEIQEFELIANIAVNLDMVTQMCHFLIVNTTQKAVNKGVEQQIISRLSNMVGFEETPTLPKWIQNQVNKGDDRDALGIVYYLNTEIDSPWYKKIKMANKAKDDDTTITQESFVSSAKKHLLSANNGLSGLADKGERNKILKNYWKAIDDLLVDKDALKDTVIYKTLGLELFNIISSTIYAKLAPEENFTVIRIKEVLKNGFDNLSNEFFEIQNPEWWQSGGGASGFNQAGIKQIATELNRAINVQTATGKFKL